MTNTMKPGDLILLRGTSWISRMITTFGQGKWSHIAVYIGGDQLIESTLGGVIKAPVTKYQVESYDSHVVDLNRDDDFRRRFVDKLTARLGDGYDYTLLIANLFYRLFGGLKFFLRLGDFPKKWSCTELVATALRECGEYIPGDVNSIMPDVIGEYFEKEKRYGHSDAV